MSAVFQELLNKLNNGELPEELNFSIKEQEPIDWEKIKYNTFYKQPSFFINKFPNPKAFMNLAGSENILESFIRNSKSPLDELLERNILSNDIINISNDLDKLPQTFNNE